LSQSSPVAPHVAPIAEPAHVITTIFNPDMYRTRYAHYEAFAEHMKASGVILHTVELALGSRAFQVTSASNPLHIQLRTRDDMWYKENLQNIAWLRLPPDVKYVFMIDADFHMTRVDWVYAALHLLQRYPVIQLYSSYSTLRADFRHQAVMSSFMGEWTNGVRPEPSGTGWLGATGGAWGYTVEALKTLNGMLETEIVGSADWYMVYALLGVKNPRSEAMSTPGCLKALQKWSAGAAKLNGRIGCLGNHAVHYFHGPYSQRGYETRWQILVKNQFDPDTDLIRDAQGLLHFAGNKPEMENEIISYFESRGDDIVPPVVRPEPAKPRPGQSVNANPPYIKPA